MLAACAVASAALLGGCLGLWLKAKVRARLRLALRARAQEIERLRATAAREVATLRLQAEVAAREEALVLRGQAEGGLQARQVELADWEAALAGRGVFLDEEARALAELGEALAAREPLVSQLEREGDAADQEMVSLVREQRGALERVAGVAASQLVRSLVESQIDDARAGAAQTVRNAGEEQAMEIARAAKRLMGIAGGRMSERFYAERAQSTIALLDSRGERAGLSEDDLHAVAEAAGVTLVLSEDGQSVRLEGQDGVGRELARRCVAQMLRKPGVRGPAIAQLARDIGSDLEREIVASGRRAFVLLKLDRAHPELVKLVGRLNFRASYAQNQWEHVVEAGFLCGMMAAEIGLDAKVARRAALLHDIGKALTHELDGSHALIGAEHARRLGEAEPIVNAIGAHHGDEPFGSAYAYLVAAADAMSGGRPGARRQSEDNHVAKLGEIERVACGFAGVAEAFAVQGGREVRVYVEEQRIGDAATARLAADIAQAISREVTFPGQIKITVIRQFSAVEMAS